MCVCVWQLPIFNVYITKRWDIGQRWQSTLFTELIPNVVLILNWAASFPLPLSLVLVSIKKRFRTAWCATKQSNSTQNRLKYPSRSVSFIHLLVWWIRIGVYVDNWQPTFKSSVGFLCHAKPSQSKRSQITYEHNLHIRRCHTTLHIRSNKGDKFIFTDVFFFLSLRLLQHIPVKWLTLINLIVTPAYNLGKRICRKTPCLMAIHFHANFLPLAKRPQSKIEIMEKTSSLRLAKRY